MKMNWKVIANILGLLLGLNGLFMLLGVPFSLYYREGGLMPLLVSGGATTAFGAGLWFLTRGSEKGIRKREGYVIVTLGWIVMSLSGTLPYILSGAIPDFAGAFFETLSGYTTTGASVMTDIEAQPKGILFWRSVTHWIGGMGIIVLTIAILPILGIGGMQLFVAESPGPSADKLHPRIQETAKRLWALYVILTVVETLLLMLGGVSFYESLCHSFATVSTGGFSTRNISVAAFGPYVQWVIIVFMFLSGINFTLMFWGLRGKLDRIWKNEEFRYYLGLVIVASIVVAGTIVYLDGEFTEKAIRDAFFQVISVVTTTGFVTADFTVWTPLITVLFCLLFFIGGSAGSTSGGVKIVRHIIIIKNSFLEFRRLIHPNAVVPVRLHKKAVNLNITFNVLAFFIIYLSTFALGTVVMAIILPDVSGMEGEGAMFHRFSTAVGASASCLGNVGPGFAGVGPVENYSWIPAGGKLFLAFQMLVGRLELFTVLILFSPSFWRKT